MSETRARLGQRKGSMTEVDRRKGDTGFRH